MTEHIAFAFLIGFLVAFVLVIPLSVGDTKKDRREGFRRGVLNERMRMSNTVREIEYPEDLQLDEGKK